MESRSSDDPAITAAFLQAYLADVERGGPAPLADYLARFPGHERTVAREYLLAVGDEDAGTGSEPSPGVADESIWLRRLRSRTSMGRYGARELIGRGGMGSVFEVWDADLERFVAMKVLEAPVAELSARTQRFIAEVKVLGGLSHPGVVPVHDVGIDDDGLLFFTMPRIQGDRFDAVLRAGGGPGDPAGDGEEWGLQRLVAFLARVGQTVAYAHTRGVVHRDLKPSNLMVGPFGESFVLDWGVARLRGQDIAGGSADGAASPGTTLDGDVVGTPAYMAPEQARGELDGIDARTDVYALGALLYEVLTGAPPYVGSDVVDQVRQGPPRPVTVAALSAPPALVAVCEKAMARDRSDRYRGAEDYAADLQAFLDARVVSAYRTGAWAELHSWVRRHRLATVGFVVAVLCLVSGLWVSVDAWTRAEERARVTRASLRTARQSIWSMLGKVASETLVDIPQMDGPRQEMLAQAVALHRELRDLAGDDPEMWRELAAAQVRLGKIQWQLGMRTEAFPTLEQAVADHETLAGLTPLLAEDHGRIATAWNLLGALASDVGDYALGEERMRRGLAAARRCFEEGPGTDEACHRVAEIAGNLAALASKQRDYAALVDRVGEAMSWSRRAVEIDASRSNRRTLARYELDLAYGLARLKRLESASKHYQQSLRELRALYEEDPQDREVRVTYADVCNRLGVEMRGRQPERAQRYLKRAIELRRDLWRDFPDYARYAGELGGAISNLADVAARTGRHEDAKALAQEAIGFTAQAVEALPGNVVFVRYLGQQRSKLARALLKLDEGDAAVVVAEELWQTDGSSGTAFAAARTIAHAVAGGATTARPERAVELLRLAWERGFRGPASKLGSEFDALRERDDFRKFIDGLAGG